MNKLNFVQGDVKLPPGFRFQPTDEENVFHYLAHKIFSLPLPSSVVPEIILSKFDPWDLPGDGEQDRCNALWFSFSQDNLGSWVLCRIFLRMRSTDNDEEIVRADKDERHESVRVVHPSSSSCCSSSSSRGSSVITRVVTSSWLGHE
ncbi:NAC (No Apical Meristem) domain transcriptional regulator superfamily protein [Actinidia rufa]|uniref:NAC (No Apical Meristem) domain transcriptional regulator superfamily protein n=1 Tax=Actinidia rufa TaxID=165716 RepID=A0A7J0FZM6_9ERIC|nr:NAC (No Apical Meristem) domain transcriptional regulator superfamily protein [Actinidia rufa]